MISWRILSLALLVKSVHSVTVWGQCGGIGYSGSTVCDAGSACVKQNDYYSQCQPGAAAPAPTQPAPAPTQPAPAPTQPAPAPAPGGGNPSSVPRGQLTEIKNFGSNPTNVQFFIYVPRTLAANPALIVVPHYCTGTAQAIFTGTRYRTLADSMGFIVIYPDAPDSGGCWDVHSTATFTHNAGGDSLGIASMTRWTIATFGVDQNKVFVTGTSSGAMMTNVLAGAYPDLFKAGSAFAGVPYGCFAGASMWNSACANGQTTKTAQQWGDQARTGYTGFTGTRPRLQFWHGTSDETLNFHNFGEEIKQWSNVLGVSGTAVSTTNNYPVNGWTRSDYGSTGSPSTIKLMGIVAQGVPHNIPTQETQVLQFFGMA